MGFFKYIGCKGLEVLFNNMNLFLILFDGDFRDFFFYFFKVRLDFRIVNWKKLIKYI